MSDGVLWRVLSSAPLGWLAVADGVALDLVQEIESSVIAHAERRPTHPSLNVGGWRSDESFFANGGRAIAALREHAKAAIASLPIARAGHGREIVGWAVVNRCGSHHPRHQHRDAVVSGIYYVTPGRASRTPTMFELPDGRTVGVEPAAGRIVLFPGSMYHSVPQTRTDLRITIAFDARR